MPEHPPRLYALCLGAAVADCVTLCNFSKKVFRILPDNVLFDFYHKMFHDKRLCLLGVEYSDLKVFTRMLKVSHKRIVLFRCVQSLIDHGSSVMDELDMAYAAYTKTPEMITEPLIDLGILLGGFFSEGGWYAKGIAVLNTAESYCRKRKRSADILRKLLTIYHKKLYVEAVYCCVKEGKETYAKAMDVIEELEKVDELPNLAGFFANLSAYYYVCNDFDSAYRWAREAVQLLDNSLPESIVIETLRQASKACVAKRRFKQAELLINQGVARAALAYAKNGHPAYSDVLMDYGFFLLNYDSAQDSVRAYERALAIRKDIFEKNNIHVGIAHEDLAYALYVNEYSSGRFYSAREHAERALKIMDRIVPKDHLLLASAKRVKALILEEIALDMRDENSLSEHNAQLRESESLQKAALAVSLAVFGENNVQTAKHYGNLGRLYQSMTKYEQAEKMHLRAIKIKESILGPDDYEVGLSVGHLASLYNYHMKRHQDAEKLYKRSIDISLRLFGGYYSGLEYDYRGLTHVYMETNDVTNMLHYTYLIREWRATREGKAPEKACPETVRPIEAIVEEFRDM